MVYTIPYKKVVDYSLNEKIDRDKIEYIAISLPVFLSSRISGLEGFRRHFADKLSGYGFPVIGWEVGETFGTAQTADPREVYLNNLEKAKIYLGILDLEYGAEISDTGISATEDEYNHAVSSGKEVVLFVSRKPKVGKAKVLEEKWLKLHTVGLYRDSLEMEKILGETISNILLAHSENWIMVGDLVLNASYSEKNDEIIIDKVTSKEEIVEYLDRIELNSDLSFIDIDLGETTSTILLEKVKTKRFAGIFEYTIKLKKQPRLERESWNRWKNYKDIDISSFNFIEGEPHLRQALAFSLNVNKGEIPMAPDSGSNLYNICQTYSKNGALFRILATIDIIETLTRSRLDPIKKLPSLPISCLERISVLEISNISNVGFDAKLQAKVKDKEDLLHDIEIKWPQEEEPN